MGEEKQTVGEILDELQSFYDIPATVLPLTRIQGRILIDGVREMEDTIKMASEYSWALGEDSVTNDDWGKLIELQKRLRRFHEPSWFRKKEVQDGDSS